MIKKALKTASKVLSFTFPLPLNAIYQFKSSLGEHFVFFHKKWLAWDNYFYEKYFDNNYLIIRLHQFVGIKDNYSLEKDL